MKRLLSAVIFLLTLALPAYAVSPQDILDEYEIFAEVFAAP